jgi:hypothetical protein
MGIKAQDPMVLILCFLKQFGICAKVKSLPKCFSFYFVTLIPKVNSPFTLGDFRPISLLGFLFKIIAKVLTARLASVIDSLVASTQSAFIKGGLLVDGVVVINKVVDLARRNGQSCLIFRVDFEKAYNSVDWSFLDYMLDRFGFCTKWKEWIRACVFAGNMSVLINGPLRRDQHPTRFETRGSPSPVSFPPSRGRIRRAYEEGS